MKFLKSIDSKGFRVWVSLMFTLASFHAQMVFAQLKLDDPGANSLYAANSKPHQLATFFIWVLNLGLVAVAALAIASATSKVKRGEYGEGFATGVGGIASAIASFFIYTAQGT